MLILRPRRAAGSFNDVEAKALRDAYVLALRSLGATHAVSDNTKAALADVIIGILKTEIIPISYAPDVAALAARSVERFVTFGDLQRLGRSPLRPEESS